LPEAPVTGATSIESGGQQCPLYFFVREIFNLSSTALSGDERTKGYRDK
jgi:hypothetical protein